MGVIFPRFKYSIRQNFEIFCDDILTNTAAEALPQSLYPHNNHQPIAKYRAYFAEKFHNYVRICIASKICDEKLFFSGFGRARATELSLRKFLQRTY